MKNLNDIQYTRIATAINYLQLHIQEQPDLATIAEHVNISPDYLQRIFTEWVGISPLKFRQYLSLSYTKGLISNKQATLFDVTHEVGLSSTSRLHDLYVKIEGMTPKEFKQQGKGLTIHYSFASTPFGEVIVASTKRGICLLTFCENNSAGLSDLKQRFPNATLIHKEELSHQNALQIFTLNWNNLSEIKLHLQGSEFQLKVWEALLTIPLGNLTTYKSIAHKINQPSASRAVGTAIGSNPIAFLIPCHRVIQTSGQLGGYMWGTTRKSAIIGWEGIQAKN
jgi:AraC family transcriptional regulator of adaptative response/methylated-DNA-[protein]-cysteine methyltransferase